MAQRTGVARAGAEDEVAASAAKADAEASTPDEDDDDEEEDDEQDEEDEEDEEEEAGVGALTKDLNVVSHVSSSADCSSSGLHVCVFVFGVSVSG